MVARGAGDVGCAHCTLLGADRSCQVCTRMVCERCGADWSTCPEPSGRRVELPATSRVRDVDPSGRLGLVLRWRGPIRLFDLRQLRWIDGPSVPRSAYSRSLPGRLTSDGRLLYPQFSDRGDQPMFLGFTSLSLHDGLFTRLDDLPLPLHGPAVTSTRDHFYYVTDAQLVTIVLERDTLPGNADAVSLPNASAPRTWTLEPMPRKVLQAVYYDAERELLATGTWGELVLCRVVDGKALRTGHVRTTDDLRWIAIGGPWLAAGVAANGGTEVSVWRIEHDLSIGVRTHQFPGDGILDAASISTDGRYLALAYGKRLRVYALDSGHVDAFDDHTDRINLVRFVGSDHRLISADCDATLIVRPRTPTGYTRPLVTIDVPETPIS